MKKLMIILLAAGLAFNASAQKFGHGSVYYARPRVVVSAGLFSPFYYPYNGYPFYQYPSYGYMQRPTRLELQIQDIKNDYQDKIWAAKHDKTVSRKERKNNVHELKHERDEAIIRAKRDYYKPQEKPAG